jgi:hypothetical protein
MEAVNTVRPKYDEMAEETGRTVMRLPPNHCELKPIDLVWAQTKRNIRTDTTFKIKIWFDSVTADGMQDNIEPLIVVFGDNSSSSEDSAYSDQGNRGEDDHYMEGAEPLHQYEKVNNYSVILLYYHSHNDILICLRILNNKMQLLGLNACMSVLLDFCLDCTCGELP